MIWEILGVVGVCLAVCTVCNSIPGCARLNFAEYDRLRGMVAVYINVKPVSCFDGMVVISFNEAM